METGKARAVRIIGEPLCAAVAALRLLAADPGFVVFLSLDTLAEVEGDLFPLNPRDPETLRALDPVTTLRWPGFVVVGRDGQRSEGLPIGLVDPLQCLAELGRYDVRSMAAAPPNAAILRLTALPAFAAPSRMLQRQSGPDLERPVLHEASGRDTYRQYLPCGPGMVMVRERIGPAYDAAAYFHAHRCALGTSPYPRRA